MSDMMMEWKNVSEDQKPVSVFQGDEHCISRILSRDASIGRSSRIFSRRAQGVPFKWEKNPGTPKNPQEEDQIPPPSPSPLMQSLGLPLPNVDGLHRDHGTNESALKRLIVMCLRKMSKKNIISDISKKVEILGKWRSSGRKKESSRFGDSNGEFVGSVKGSSFSSNSSFSSDSRALDASMIDGPFCCNPLEVHAVVDEGNTKIYYCNHHKAAFAVEEDNLFLSNILSGVSASDHEQAPTGIPFQRETQPGTSKSSTENELIQSPSHLPAVQGTAMSRPRRQDNGEEADKDSLTSKVAWFRRRKKKETQNVKTGISFRSDEEFEASFRRSDSIM
ncbi:hypothetical protein OROGR_006494 [Orobanche gracilis]